jgi:hypothetical protein
MSPADLQDATRRLSGITMGITDAEIKKPKRQVLRILARLEGFEPPTLGLEGRCSIQLSYRRVLVFCGVTEREARCGNT